MIVFELHILIFVSVGRVHEVRLFSVFYVVKRMEVGLIWDN